MHVDVTSSPVERFKEFFQGYADENGKFIYVEQVQKMALEGLTSLFVDYDDILRYDPGLAQNLRDEPEEIMQSADEALLEVLRIEDLMYAQDTEDVLKVRFSNIPDLIDLRQLRSTHLGNFIAIEGIILRQSVVKPLLVQGVFQCLNCSEIHYIPQERGLYTEPSRCVNPNCGKKGPFKLIPEESIYTDVQTITVQEKPETLPPGQIPRSLPARMVGDLVDVVRAGDRAIINGILRMKPSRQQKKKQLATFDPWLEVNFAASRQKEFEEIEIDPETEKQILELSRDINVHRKIVRSIAPSIYGHEITKEAIATVIFGGVARVTEDGMKQRGESNLLLVGDPGVGKSQLLHFANRLAPRGIFASGRASSAAGLTAAVVRDPDTGEFSLEAGALVLADRGIATIDEFDKMTSHDRSAIHETMEQHTVSIAKAGIVAQLNARTAIIAAANPKHGRYEESQHPVDNINLPATIVSRFDLIYIMQDKPEEDSDRRMARHILELRRGHSTPTAEPPIEMDFLRKYISYAKQHVEPSLTDEAMKRIEEFYLGLRNQSDSKSIAITPRYLEAIIRLSEAQARMALKEDVTIDHVEAAIQLLEVSLEQVGRDPVTGKVDIDYLLQGTSRSATSKLDQVISLIKEEARKGITDDVQISVIKKRAYEEKQIEADFVDKVIRQLKDNGEIYSPRDGVVRLA